MKLPTWWCVGGDLGPLDPSVYDVTLCFQYTCIALPVALGFFLAFLKTYFLCPGPAETQNNMYHQLFGSMDSEVDRDSSVGINQIRQLCTAYSRPLWVSLIALTIFPFAEIVIRFALGLFVSDACYPYLGIIAMEIFRSGAYVMSVWVLLSTSQITPLVRCFWFAEAVVTLKELEGGLMRTIFDDYDQILLIHALKFIFNTVLFVYALKPSFVGEEDILWPADESVRYTPSRNSGSFSPTGSDLLTPKEHRSGSTVTSRDHRVVSAASERVWDNFLYDDRLGGRGGAPPGFEGGAGMAAAVGSSSILDNDDDVERKGGGGEGKSLSLLSSDSMLQQSGTPPTFGRKKSSMSSRGGVVDFSSASLLVTTWLVRNKGRGEETDFAVQVKVSYETGLRLGAEGGTFRVWRAWPRFVALAAEVRNCASLHRIVPPELPSKKSGGKTGSSSGQRNLERDRGALELYLNQVMGDRRYWRPLSRFLHVEVRLSLSANKRMRQQIQQQQQQQHHQRSRSEHIGTPDRPYPYHFEEGAEGKERPQAPPPVSSSLATPSSFHQQQQQHHQYHQPSVTTGAETSGSTSAVNTRKASEALQSEGSGEFIRSQQQQQQQQQQVIKKQQQMSQPIQRFFENLFQVSVPEWTKWTAKGGSVQSLFTVQVILRQGEGYELRKMPEDFSALRSAIYNNITKDNALSRATQLPALPQNPSGAAKDEEMELVRNHYQGFLQEMSNTSIFHCEALYAFLAADKKQGSGSSNANQHGTLFDAMTPISRTPEFSSNNSPLTAGGASLLEEKRPMLGGGGGLGNPLKLQTQKQQQEEGGGGGESAFQGEKKIIDAETMVSKGGGGMMVGDYTEEEDRLRRIAVILTNGVRVVADKRNRLLFRGSDAVDFLVLNGVTRDRRHAVNVGNALMLNLRLFDHIDLSHAFRDDKNIIYVLHPERVQQQNSAESSSAAIPIVPNQNHEPRRRQQQQQQQQQQHLEVGSGKPGSDGRAGGGGSLSSQTEKVLAAVDFSNSPNYSYLLDAPVGGGERKGDDAESATAAALVVGSTQSTESIPPENRRKESILVEGKDNKKTEFFLQKKGGRRRLNQGLASVAASSHRFEASVRGYTAGTPTFFNIHVREYYSTTQYLDYNIRRRYSDFEKFRKMLVAVHGDSRVPNLPTKIQPIMQKKDTYRITFTFSSYFPLE
eukprot:jgi/Bigna1/90048/estExt_fgenesh1_pg.C_610028